MAEALAFVHDHTIVHRDVKPSNILMTAHGEARLGDFGIARLLDASTLTVAGTTLGTAAYMAPEQLEDHQVGPGADIWSLGMVLLECLTGQRRRMKVRRAKWWPGGWLDQCHSPPISLSRGSCSSVGCSITDLTNASEAMRWLRSFALSRFALPGRVPDRGSPIPRLRLCPTT